MKAITIIFLLSVATTSFSQINSFYVKPILTDINYDADQDSHMVVRNTTTHLNILFLFIGGTESNTKSYQTISLFAGNLGYDVINLAYPNSIAAASLANSPDSLAFNKYRQEVCYGTSLSPDVTVDSLNSIYTRTLNLIHYLHTTYPNQNWDQYLLDPSTLNWNKIAVGGHSQGSGHACYLAKSNDVERVLMFSGPNDYSNYFSQAAHWLRNPGVTTINKHFSYLSLLDEVVSFDKQLINLQGLGLYPLYDTTYVDDSSSPFNDSRCLYTRQTPGIALLYHNATVKFSFINNAVWTYMLTTVIPTRAPEVHLKRGILIYPNPTTSMVNINSEVGLLGMPYLVRNLTGQKLLRGNSRYDNCFTIDLSPFASGIYFITIDHETFKVVKH